MRILWYYLWKERRLPGNVDPLKSNLADKLERDRVAPGLRARAQQDRRSCTCRSNATTAPRIRIGRQAPAFLRQESLSPVPEISPLGFLTCRSIRCHG